MATDSSHDFFAGSSLDPNLRWHCEPKRWSFESVQHVLRIEPDAGTDFWRKTHYGFEADNGHFLYATLTGDFVLSVHIRSQPANQYDQAGLMVRLSPECWLKTSIEYEPEGPNRLGAVVTNDGYSDWSTQSVPSGPSDVWLRVHREGDDYIVESSWDGTAWQQIRMTHLAGGNGIAAGVYACSPKGAGFVAAFRELKLSVE
jgi:regulation of enolase protein 1 (concanavalin A-like superfamily)